MGVQIDESTGRAAGQRGIERVPTRSIDGATADQLFVEARGELRAAVVVLPAMGVAAGYYEPLALGLAERGFSAVVSELRGQGSSSVRARRGVDHGYRELLDHDVSAALAAARERARGRPVHVVGHSLGGHLGALYLAEHPGAFDRLALVASGTTHFRAYPRAQQLRILAGTQTARAVAHALGFFPGHRMGFGGLQPRTVIEDWAHLGLTGRLQPRGARIDHERELREVRADVLGVSVIGDRLAPASATDALCAKLVSARLRREHVALRPGKGDPHFRWARAPEEVLDVLTPFFAGS